MKIKVNGTIKQIGEKKELASGAFVLDYVIELPDDYAPIPVNINMYSQADKVEFMDNFIKYNKVGDKVNAEMQLRGREYNGRIYNSFSHWNCAKVESESVPTNNQGETIENDDLPF